MHVMKSLCMHFKIFPTKKLWLSSIFFSTNLVLREKVHTPIGWLPLHVLTVVGNGRTGKARGQNSIQPSVGGRYPVTEVLLTTSQGPQEQEGEIKTWGRGAHPGMLTWDTGTLTARPNAHRHERFKVPLCYPTAFWLALVPLRSQLLILVRFP